MAERWHEIVGYFDPKKQEEINAGGVRVIVRGSIDDVIIVQVPAVLGEADAHRVMQSVQETLVGGGVDRPLVLMPDNIKLMKVRKLTVNETEALKRMPTSSKDAMH